MSARTHEKNSHLKDELDRWYKKINKADFILADPVQFPRRYKRREDIEISAFLAATIAWGRRDLILRSCEKMFSIIAPSPFDFVMSGDYRKLKERSIHRTFFEDDLLYFCRGFRTCYKTYGSLEAIFAQDDIWKGISLFRDTMAKANGKRYTKHISSGETGSACKRINLALRWLVRREGPVDLGLWTSIPPSSLFIPLDLHVSRVARSLSLLQRRSNDKKAVLELTENLRLFCPEDPVKYDLALFGIGITAAAEAKSA